MPEFQDGTRKDDKQLIHSLRSIQTKQHIGQCIVSTLLMLRQTMGKFRFTRLTTAHTWGKPPPSPLKYVLCLSTGATSKWHFVSRLQNGSPEIPKVGTPTTLGPDNFVCKPSIVMRSKAKLEPSSTAFQRYVARHLHARNLGRFPAFSGRESNCQFDSRPFFWP